MQGCLIPDGQIQTFSELFKEHFVKYIPKREPGQHVLLLLDGHKSHVAVDIVEWAKKIILLYLYYLHIHLMYYNRLMLLVSVHFRECIMVNVIS